MVTEKQKEAVRTIEEYVNIAPKFTGDINNPKEVNIYLSKYLRYLYEDTWAIENGY